MDNYIKPLPALRLADFLRALANFLDDFFKALNCLINSLALFSFSVNFFFLKNLNTIDSNIMFTGLYTLLFYRQSIGE